jgi:diacylglycerol O-acyltransferase
MQQLSPQDAQFLYAETEHNLTHVTAISIYDPSTVPGRRTVRFTEIIEHVRERLAYNPHSSGACCACRWSSTIPTGSRTSTSISRRMFQHGRLPEPGDWRQFCIHMARYHSRPLDMNRPPWEMYVSRGWTTSRGWRPAATPGHEDSPRGGGRRFGDAFFCHAWRMRITAARRSYRWSRGRGAADLPPVPQLLRRALRNNLALPCVSPRRSCARRRACIVRRRTAVARREEPKHPVPATRFNVDVSPHKMFDARSSTSRT